MKKTIYLQKIGDIDTGILILLKKNLKRFFKKYNIKVVILADQLPLLDSECNYEERKYNARKIRKRLITHGKDNNYYRILGVTNIDILTKSSKFLFGVADMPKNKSFGGALISDFRLREEFYGRTENIDQFEQRVFKEAIHELGHTFVLEHCENLCVMRPSNSLKEADGKPHDFCEICLKKLSNYLS
ncbi:MAG: archaemetzincin family Zn-dependent metalloprotease [Promethearchaeota archaeon]